MAKKGFGNEAVSKVAEACRLLSDETRLKIVFYLAQKEQNVGALCQTLKLAQPTVSHHLGLLRMGRLIINRRQGKQVFYCLNTDLLKSLSGELAKYVPALVRGK
jgi:ArsR family transcriptional regulator